ncbi:MAG: hypothetical protein GWN84_17810 [Gammaproteobacteria bacterium]|nr:hypothetical protein [Gammaproteobacteria bacterium]NIR88957.1 hypothetical protein [Gammaproteobacteria bacterium]NIU05246.1 hypothetical protein [Gammaproteobacteria bacterium]NIV52861.1 hypothetical protein [Gammaproteobacteria bacterium]NIW85157.1 hypothetical protein [Gammaproteobacteria bacterium]
MAARTKTELRTVSIGSVCGTCRAPMAVTTSRQGTALDGATPAETVVYVGIQYREQAATSLRRVIRFFCSPEHLENRRDDNANIEGYALSLEEGLRAGRAIFAPFLTQPSVER